jgi:hypothetical protein
MVNEGYKKLFLGVFVVLHLMVFAFGIINYQMKDTLEGARATFGVTYAVARAAALVLHVDIALIMFRECSRCLISQSVADERFSCMSNAHITLASDAVERNYTVWYAVL